MRREGERRRERFGKYRKERWTQPVWLGWLASEPRVTPVFTFPVLRL